MNVSTDDSGDSSGNVSSRVRTDLRAEPGAPEMRGASFDDFFHRNHPPIVRALSVALGDPELGRDAASEAFTRALQRWERVGSYANPAGWTYRVGLNWATSRLRKFRREVRHDRDTPAADLAAGDPSITTALQQLSVDHRAVIVGRFYLDWSEAQLAESLGIPVGTVKSRLHRALDQLETLLEASHG